MPPARQRAPAPWRKPLCKSLLWCEAISVGEKSQGGCVGSWGQPLTSAPTAAETPAGASQPLSWHPPSFGPAIDTCPHLAVPLTRGFGDSFRDDEPQRGGMGHGGQDRLSVARGWFPSIFSISTACALGCKEAKYRNTSCPKVHRVFASLRECPAVATGCHRPGTPAIGIFNYVWTLKCMLLGETAAGKRGGLMWQR